jgi:hypothetical protein
VTVVEDQGRKPGLGEALGVRAEALVAHCGEAVRQDYARGWTATAFHRSIEPRRAPRAGRLKRDITALNGSSSWGGCSSASDYFSGCERVAGPPAQAPPPRAPV